MSRDVLVVAHQYLPSDPRVRNSIQALLDAGLSVDAVCLRRPGEPFRGALGRARLFRMPVRRHRGGGLPVYLFEYLAFFLLATLTTCYLFLHHRYRVVITHTLPDPLVFSALLPRLVGRPVFIDLHEFTPELFQTRYGVSERHPLIRATRWLERLSCGFASGVITVHDLGPRILANRGVAPRRTAVVMNTPELGRWAAKAEEARRSRPPSSPFTLVYHGTIVNQYDLITVVEALALLREDEGPRPVLRVVGEGPGLDALESRVAQLSLEGQVRFEDPVPMERIPAILGQADAAVAVMGDVPYSDVALPMKLLEAMSLAVPVIATPGAAVRHYFSEDQLCYVPHHDPAAVARAIRRLLDDADYRRSLAESGREAVRPIRGEVMAERLVEFIGEVQ